MQDNWVSRRDALKIGGAVGAGILGGDILSGLVGMGEKVVGLELTAAHMVAEKAICSSLLDSDNTVLPSWPDQNGWKEFPNQFKSPLEVMYEAADVCKSMGVIPIFVQHGERLTSEKYNDKLFNELKSNYKIGDGLEGIIRNMYTVFLTDDEADGNSNALANGYGRFDDLPILNEMSILKSETFNLSNIEDKLNVYIKQVEQRVNIFQKAVNARGGDKLTMGMLAGFCMAENNGDIMKGIYEAAEICEFLTRGQTRIDATLPGKILRLEKDNGEWNISITDKNEDEQKQPLDILPNYYEGIFLLNSICLDQTSLVAPVDYLVKIAKNEENSVALDSEQRGKVTTFAQNDDFLLRMSQYQNTCLRNRSGAYYHFFSTISLLTVADPELVAMMVASNYKIDNLIIDNPEKLSKLAISADQGHIKVTTDLNTASYLAEIYEYFKQFRPTV